MMMTTVRPLTKEQNPIPQKTGGAAQFSASFTPKWLLALNGQPFDGNI
jgi:hypothetical protein